MYRGDFSLEGWSHLQFHYCEYLEADRCCKFYYIFLKFNKLHLKKQKQPPPHKICQKPFPAVPNCQPKKFRMTNLFHFFLSLRPEHREFCLYDPSHISAISTIINISELISPKPDLVLSLSVALCEFSECAEVPLETSQLRSRSRARFSITAASPLP